ncbi:hypothetical protein [Halococcoides cellulosivorans]|uniref:Uncharacterized protein n=1 Tax=Halococcoides cellulosivorans TaxID=1679096 RepID=A0A2R4WXX5_9EURY|nr:hypothetical protein [Halococcoides cellulosivorans]AWB26395.1 hypothetical protein HARCEL1_00990 [Halococcoides cellulosivorans]
MHPERISAELVERGRSALETVVAALALVFGGAAGALTVAAALRRLGLASLTTGSPGRIVFVVGFLLGSTVVFAGFVVWYRIQPLGDRR